MKPLKKWNVLNIYSALIHTRPSVDLMLASCTTSKCAAWDTMGSDDSEMMWSHTPDKVLHWVVEVGKDCCHRKVKCHRSSAVMSWAQLTTCRILFSVSYTEQSWGRMVRKAQLPLEKCVRNWVIIGISAVGGYKQKSSSLAPITRHTPTQTSTNTKQMNHQCGGTSPSLSQSFAPFFFPCPKSLSLSRLQLFFFTPTAHF